MTTRNGRHPVIGIPDPRRQGKHPEHQTTHDLGREP